MKPRTRPTARRKRALKNAGHTYDDLAQAAGVSWRMVKYWIDGERTSWPIAREFARLTARAR